MKTPARGNDTTSVPQSGADLLMGVFDAFERAAIPWSTLPARPSISEKRPAVDLLVGRDHLEVARKTVAGLGFLPDVATDERTNPCFLAYVPVADEWLLLRIVTRLTLGPLALEAEDLRRLLSSRQDTGSVVDLAPADAFWIMLLNFLFDEAVIDDVGVARLQELAPPARPEGELARLTAGLAPVGMDEQVLVDWARRGDRASLERAREAFRAEAEGRRRIGVRRATGGTVTRSLQLARPRSQGLTIALLAPDGAGKSTVAAALCATLPIPVRVIYMGRARTSSRGRRGSVASGLLRQWRRHLTARYHRYRGRIVLFDRYTYDALLPPRNPKPARIARRWVFAHAVPPPDLVVLLDAPADVMWQRKDEHSQEFLEQRRNDYLELKSRLPGMVVVDAGQGLEDVRRDITSAIWSAYSDR